MQFRETNPRFFMRSNIAYPTITRAAEGLAGCHSILPGSVLLDFRGYAASVSQARRMVWISAGVGAWG